MVCIPQYIRFHTVDASVLVLLFVVSHEIDFFTEGDEVATAAKKLYLYKLSITANLQ